MRPSRRTAKATDRADTPPAPTWRRRRPPPPAVNAVRIRPGVNSPVSRRSQAQATNVTGTRKLPSSTTVGMRFGLAVTNVTTTAATHSANPPTRIRGHTGRRTAVGRVGFTVPVTATSFACPAGQRGPHHACRPDDAEPPRSDDVRPPRLAALAGHEAQRRAVPNIDHGRVLAVPGAGSVGSPVGERPDGVVDVRDRQCPAACRLGGVRGGCGRRPGTPGSVVDSCLRTAARSHGNRRTRPCRRRGRCPPHGPWRIITRSSDS
jgi:hypothetical protein